MFILLSNTSTLTGQAGSVFVNTFSSHKCCKLMCLSNVLFGCVFIQIRKTHFCSDNNWKFIFYTLIPANSQLSHLFVHQHHNPHQFHIQNGATPKTFYYFLKRLCCVLLEVFLMKFNTEIISWTHCESESMAERLISPPISVKIITKAWKCNYRSEKIVLTFCK